MRPGNLRIAKISVPLADPGEILIANVASGLSAGTERTVSRLAKKSILKRVRERPDLVRRVIEECRNEGTFAKIRDVREQRDTPLSLGYSSAGVVLACGPGVQQFKPGDRVASNGPPAEIASVNKRFCARIPTDVDFDQAAFAVLGAIALRGVRLSRADLGETVFVVGLGLIGQLTVGLLAAAGCCVIGTDPDATKCQLACEKMGAEFAQPNLSAAEVESFTAGLGADAVIITASTPSDGPIGLAAAAVREKGRIVVMGVAAPGLDRRPCYFKEAEFVVSCSYGRGRHDSSYEDRGHAYPAAYVRWTEQRNLQAVLELLSRRRLDIGPLITHRFPMDEADQAYNLIERGDEAPLGILLEYPGREDAAVLRAVRLSAPRPTGQGAIGVLGTGNLSRLALLPALRNTGRLRLTTLCTLEDVSAVASRLKFGFEKVTTDEDEVFSDPDLDAVVLLTRPDLHAGQVIRALRGGKAVFVDSPLCLTRDEIAEIHQVLCEGGDAGPFVMVGFNRRFSQAAVAARRFFADVKVPLTAAFRFHAGSNTPDHSKDDLEGGGLVTGKACHGIDLVTFLVNSPPVRVFAESIGGLSAPSITDESYFITLRHANGAVSTVAYLAGDDQASEKERVEVIGGGRIAVIDSFHSLTTCCGGRTNRTKFRGQDQGHTDEIAAFAQTLGEGGASPIPWEEIRSVTLASILTVRSVREGIPIDLQ